jgi:hypothetical protein
MTKQLKKVTFQVEVDGISVPAYSRAMAKKYRQAPRIVFQGETLQNQIDNANERISQVGFRISNKLPNGATLIKRSQAFGKSDGFKPVTIVLAEWNKGAKDDKEYITWECYSPSMEDTSQGGYFLCRHEGNVKGLALMRATADYKKRCADEASHSLPDESNDWLEELMPEEL